MTKRMWCMSGVGIALAVIGVGWSWHMMTLHALVSSSVPEHPVLKNWPAELQQRIVQCESNAHAGSIAGLAELSRLYHANGFSHEAIRCYQGLIRADPVNPHWTHLLANLFAGYGRLDEALPLEQRTVSLAPNYVPARLLLARSLLKTNHETEAKKVYASVVTQDAKNVYALEGMARCDLAQNAWTAARDHLIQAETANGKFEEAPSLLATVYEHLGNPAAAQSARMRAEAAGRFHDFPDPWMDELMVDCYDSYRLSVAAAVAGANGDGATAKRLLERTVAFAPDQGWTHRLLGQLLDQLNDRSAAYHELQRAVELDPAEPRNWSQLALLQLHENDPAAAEKTFIAGLKHCSSDGNLHYEYGALLMDAGRLDAAVNELQDAKRLKPNHSAAYFDLARIYIETGREAEGLAELHQILTFEPEHPFALLTLARNAVRVGDETEARRWLDRVRHQPHVPADSVARLLTAYQERFGRTP